MSTTNEATEMWSDVRRSQAEARARRKDSNLAILKASSVPFQYRNDNDIVLVRLPGYPQSDYWPSTSRWKFNGRHILGDATAFLEWLERKRKA